MTGGALHDDDRDPVWRVSDAGVDLAEPSAYVVGAPWDLWRAAREQHPVAWTLSARVGPFWSVTAHDLGRAVLTDPTTFVSGRGMRLDGTTAAVRAATDKMMVVSDGRTHRGLRGAHAAHFSRSAVAAAERNLARRVEERLRLLLTRTGVVDLVTELSLPVPRWALFDLMGVPDADRDRLARLTAAAFDDANQSGAGGRARTAAHAAVFAYFAGQVRTRRSYPGEDLVSTLTRSRVLDEPLTDEVVVLNCDGVLNGGLETTPHAISGAVEAFAADPAAWDRLRHDPDLMETAVEEVLRWTSPAMQAMRTATRDVTLGDARVRAGDRVVVWLPACNRDPAVFPDPNTFRIDRQPGPHLAFGAGPHVCIGGTLARMELSVVLSALARRVERFEVVGEVPRQPSVFLHGVPSLRTRLTPVRGGEAA